jgi:hypothetical protein
VAGQTRAGAATRCVNEAYHRPDMEGPGASREWLTSAPHGRALYDRWFSRPRLERVDPDG